MDTIQTIKERELRPLVYPAEMPVVISSLHNYSGRARRLGACASSVRQENQANTPETPDEVVDYMVEANS